MAMTASYGSPRLDLAEALIEFPLTQTGFVGLDILPIFKTDRKDASFSTITRACILRARETRRKARSAYSRDDFETADKSYACEEDGHEVPIDDAERAFYARDFDADLITSGLARDVLLREQEKRIATKIFDVSASGWTSGTAALYTDVSTDWDDVASTIVADIDAAKSLIRANCGMKPNTLVVSEAHLKSFKNNTDIKSRLQYVQALTDDAIRGALGSLFGIEKVLIAEAVKSTGGEGDSFTGADIWSDDYCWLGIVPRSLRLAEPGVGRTFLWTADSPDNVTVEQYREEQTRSDVFRVRQHTDEKVIDVFFGHILKIDT